ncbi:MULTISPECIES: hypothetical protein [unclassified Bradyrhizobium]|nr:MULTISPECIES: hypothetical protein [unclassified Bradyrhizobium]
MSAGETEPVLVELRKKIRRAYRSNDARGRDKSTPGEELRAIIRRKRKAIKGVPKELNVWLMFFDEAIAFWFAIWSNYKENISGPSSRQAICLMALSGRIFQDMLCLRELITGGFSVQANVIARSLIEAVDVMHLLNWNPELAERFRNIDTNEEASKFWHEHCSRDKIHKIVKARWLWFCGHDEDAASAFHSQRKDYVDITGMSVHPSFAASFTTFMDSYSSTEESIFDIVLGTTSPMSKFTMHLILLRIFEYGILWTGPKLGLYKAENKFDAVDPFLHNMLSKGLNVIASILRTVDNPGEPNPFFPEFQTYWPRPNAI